MRLSVMVLGLVCLCAVVIGIAAPVVQDDDDVRGAFITSRPKSSSTGAATAKPSRRRPKANPGINNPSKQPDKTPVKPGPGPSKPAPSPSQPVTPVNAR